MRRSDPFLVASARDDVRARADGDVLVVAHRVGSDVRVIDVNFGAQPRAHGELPELVGLLPTLWSSAAHPGEALPPRTTILFSGRAAGRR